MTRIIVIDNDKKMAAKKMFAADQAAARKLLLAMELKSLLNVARRTKTETKQHRVWLERQSAMLTPVREVS